MLEIKVVKLTQDAKLPEKAHEDDAGYDLFAQEGAVLAPGQSILIPTGIALALPPMTEGQIRPRSGLALQKQITVLNSPGTIDAGYRGEIGVILINHGTSDFVVEKGMRIAQLVIAPVLDTSMVRSESLDDTQRGIGGFGSTDKAEQ